MRKALICLWMVVFVYETSVGQKPLQSYRFEQRISPALKQFSDQKLLVEIHDSSTFFAGLRKIRSRTNCIRLAKNLFQFDQLTVKDLQNLAGWRYADRANRVPQEEAVLGDFDLSLNKVRAAHALYPGIDGAGKVISIKEKPFHQDDLDLLGRIVPSKHFDEPPSLHATLMATIAAGAGNSVPFARGVAFAANVTTSDFARLLPDPIEELTSSNVTVQNHSYGVGLENYYGIESKEYDLQVVNNPWLVHVFSSGNQGDRAPVNGSYAGLAGFANLTGQFKVSKNTIAVGSTDLFGNIMNISSRGPAHDGRVKPELTAIGDAGSSDAAAVVSGLTALLQQEYERKYGVLPDAALLKAMMINTADDKGQPEVDFENGFGLADALGALRTLDRQNFYSGTIASGQTSKRTITIPAGSFLKVTLCWTDPPAEPFSNKTLVNDLGIQLRNTTTGEITRPWVLDPGAASVGSRLPAARGVDTLNNVEQITLTTDATSEYEIIVGSNRSIAEQKFFVAFEFEKGFEWTYPTKQSSLPVEVGNIVRWNYTGPATSGSIWYRFEDSDWIFLDDVDLTQSYYSWTASDLGPGVSSLKIVIDGEETISPDFTLSTRDRLDIGFNCTSEVLFTWSAVPNATGYILYNLGERYLEAVLTTMDTFAIVEKSTMRSDFFSMAPVFGDALTGLRESTIDYKTQGVDCYVISFLPESYIVADTAKFELRLGAILDLMSATLERLENGQWKQVDFLEPDAVRLVFTDVDPNPGIGTYRVRLLTRNQETVLTSEAEILHVRKYDLYVFPNPVQAGTEVTVLASDETVAEYTVYDSNGVLLGTAADTGNYKLLATSRLKPGIYFIRYQKANGLVLTSKLIVL